MNNYLTSTGDWSDTSTIDAENLRHLFEPLPESDNEVAFVPIYQNAPDFDVCHSLSLPVIRDKTLELLSRTTEDGQGGALDAALRESPLKGFLIPPQLLWNDELLYEYRKPPKKLLSGVEVPIQDGHSFALFDVENQQVTSWFATTSMFPPLVHGIPLARRAIESREGAIRVAGFCPCIRQESDSDRKVGWREPVFLQTFFERFSFSRKDLINNSDNLEALLALTDLLARYGIPNENLKVRLNSFRTVLLPLISSVIQKEAALRFARFKLNPLSYERAMGNDLTSRSIENIRLNFFEQPGSTLEVWEIIQDIAISGGYDIRLLECVCPEAAHSLKDLQDFVRELQVAAPHVDWTIDPLSVRPAYDNLHFQFDAISHSSSKRFVEIGGGGDYSLASQLAWEVRYQEPAPTNLTLVGAGLGNLRIETARREICVR